LVLDLRHVQVSSRWKNPADPLTENIIEIIKLKSIIKNTMGMFRMI
jgi:hypothetical protein